ncbi:MAG: hypothetical protein ACOYL6_14055 [Bacteriovoracaceae bacterium]
MTTQFKISGIYDRRTLKFLKEKGLTSFSFDFDPKSFNYLQGQNFREMIHEFYSPIDFYTLNFRATTPLNLEHTLNDFLMASGMDRNFMTNLLIEIPEAELSTTQSLSLPTMLKINKGSDIQSLAKASMVKGLVVDYGDLDLEHKQEEAYHFLNALFLLKRKYSLQLDIKVPWDGGATPSLFDFFPFDHKELTINRKVEVCYRNVNLPLLEKEMSLMASEF